MSQIQETDRIYKINNQETDRSNRVVLRRRRERDRSQQHQRDEGNTDAQEAAVAYALLERIVAGAASK